MTFRRDGLFWTVTLQIGIVNFYMGGFGPAQPLLRAEQGTSLAIAGLHGTAMGVAAILAGFAAPKFVHTFGRAHTAWLGIGVFCLGTIAFIFLPPVFLTLPATLIGGFGISMVINSMVTQLSDRFPGHEAKAVSQSSAIGSTGFVLGTLAVGLLAGTQISWRFGLLLAVPVSLLLFLLTRRVIVDEHVPHEDGPESGTLSRAFWISWFGFIACISGEFATTFWAAALVRDRIGSTAAISTICIVAFGSGMGLGRWFGPNLFKKYAIDTQIKFLMTTQFLGFSVLWFSHTQLISLVALLVAGLGLSMQFALCSLRLIAFSNDRPDLAIGRSSLAAGIAIACSPFLLGLLGDHFGISRAYLMVPILILIALSIIIAIPSEESRIEKK